MSETFVLYAEPARPAEIYAGDPPEPIPAEWVALSKPGQQDDSHCLYFLSAQGGILEILQYDTIGIALDQARALVGADDGSWKSCRLEVPEHGAVNLVAFASAEDKK